MTKQLPFRDLIRSRHPCWSGTKLDSLLDSDQTVEEALGALPPGELGWLARRTMTREQQGKLEKAFPHRCCFTCAVHYMDDETKHRAVRRMLRLYQVSPKTRCWEIW